jgi:hypothetical protein
MQAEEAVMADEEDPVRRYYDEKKRRYLKNLRDTAGSMRTGTPFDWEEAEAYLRDVPGGTRRGAAPERSGREGA